MIKSVLVTGGAGFIGSNLVARLAEIGYKVRILDDLSTGKLENLDSIIDGDLSFEQGSIENLVLLNSLCDVDYVIHLAAMNRAARSIENPILADRINIAGTLNVLIAARDNKVKKVVYTSSSSVYGNAVVLPKIEVYNPKPMTPYAVGKLTGEYYCSVFNDLFKLKTVSLRLFSVYGKNQRSDLEYAAVIPKFIDCMKKDKRPTIYGDGNQTRPFTYVKDVVEALILFMTNSATDVYNIACGKSYTLNYLVQCINKVLGKDIKPIYAKPRVGEIQHSSAELMKATMLGFAWGYALERGLRELIENEKKE